MITKTISPPLSAVTEFEVGVSSEKRQPLQGEWTYEDYLRLPDDGTQYEIIEGVLYMVNAPNYDHQFAVMEIAFNIKQFVKTSNLGVVLTAPFEVHLSSSVRPVQPDVIFINKSKKPMAGAKFFTGLPDLLVEVISPSSFDRDRRVKFNVYEQAGVPEYWLVDPKTQSVEVYTLGDDGYELLGQYTDDEKVESKVLSGVEMVTCSLFVKK